MTVGSFLSLSRLAAEVVILEGDQRCRRNKNLSMQSLGYICEQG